MNAGFDETQAQPEIVPQPKKDDRRKHLIMGILTILVAFGVIALITKKKGKKDKETKRVRTITKTKTIVKNKKDEIDEEINEETDDNETDDNDNNDDNGNTDDDNTDE